MTELPSLNLNSHLWRINRVKGVYMAILAINWPSLRFYSSEKPGNYWKKQLFLADHFFY
jgi:hypothetical protein